MTTIRTPVGAAVDAIQRVPVECWLASFDDPQGYPNYPVYRDSNDNPTEDFNSAVYVVWDGAFGELTAKLIKAIGDTPSLVPEDLATITRVGLLNLYQGAIDAQSQNT